MSEGEIEDDDYDRVADAEEPWNLRKCSAATLDILASTFHGTVFQFTLPYLRDNLRHQDWPNREAAVLAIGAVADGCMAAVTPHLPELVPYLISLLNDPEPVVRLITCWALGRYSGWAAHLQNPIDRQRFFEPMMGGILERMLDKNKKVQEAAASAFASLEEKAQNQLRPYCTDILRQFSQCFQKYKDRNMLILYDCIETLAEQVERELANEQNVGLLMPAMIARWTNLSNQSRELFPLLECLSYVASAMGEHFIPFAGPIFSRCIGIIRENLEQHLRAVNNEAIDKPDKDFLVTSLDLISAIVQALPKSQSGELVRSSEPRLFDLLMFCMEDPNNDVRQSSYALLGDCAVNVWEDLQPFLPSLMPVLIRQLDLNSLRDEDIDTGFSVINNACWSCGEIAMGEAKDLDVFLESLYQRFVAILRNPEIPISVNENAAIALGRLGRHYSSTLATHLPEFAKPFLHAIEPVDGTDEKVDALYGFNLIVSKNYHAMGDCLFMYLKTAVMIWPYARNHFRNKEFMESIRTVCPHHKKLPCTELAN